MATKYINSISDGTNTYKFVDDSSGYITSATDTITGWYGTCSTDAATATKVVTCSNYVLNKGNIIGILFSTANTAATPQLNINSTGAKSIYIGTSNPNGTNNTLKWSADTIIYFMYDGSNYRYITSIAPATTLQPRGANTWYGTSSTGASTQEKASDINNYVLTNGSLIAIKFSNANTYTSAKITLNINSTGAKDVYYKNAVTSSTNTLLWNAGDTLTFMYDYNSSGYRFISIDSNISPLTIRTWS